MGRADSGRGGLLYRHLASYQRVQAARSVLLLAGTLGATFTCACAGRDLPSSAALSILVVGYLAISTFSYRAATPEAPLSSLFAALDVILVSGLVWWVGDLRPEYYLLYYVPILSSGARLRPRESAATTAFAAVCYLLVLKARPVSGLTTEAALLRVGNFLAPSAVMVSLLSLLRREEEASRSLREALHDSLHRFSAVYDVAHAANAGTDIGGLLTILLEHAAQVAGAQSGAISLVQPEGTLSCMATLGQAQTEEAGIDPTGEAAQRARRTGTPVCHDASGQEVGPAAPARVYLPLLSPSGAVGVLALAAGHRRFRAKQIDFLTSLCSEAAIAVENAQLRSDLHRMAVTDYLTGLPNRREMERRLHVETEAARRYCRALAVLMIDCDELKTVNDRRGHASGDRLLCVLAQVLRDSLRAVDSAGRMGGDEFLVILPETDEDGGAIVARRIMELFQKEVLHLQSEWAVLPSPGLCIGVAATEGAATQESLLASADAALYAAKNEGKNRYRLASKQARDATSRTPLPLPGLPPQ